MIIEAALCISISPIFSAVDVKERTLKMESERMAAYETEWLDPEEERIFRLLLEELGKGIW